MINANISTLKNNLSRYLQRVRQGQTVEVFDRDQLVARIVPVEMDSRSQDDWLSQLVRLDLVRCGEMRKSAEILKKQPPGKKSVKVLHALLEERRGER